MTQPVFNYRCRKVGGIWFLRLGRLQFSFCLCRGEMRAVQHVTYPAGNAMVAHAE